MTAVEAPPATVNVSAPGLRNVLRAALVAADHVDLPPIMGVLLHSDTYQDDPVLVATATDRFMLAQIHLRAHGSLDRPVFVPNDSVKTLIAGTEPDPAGTVTISTTDSTMTVTGINGITVPLDKVAFPRNIAERVGPYTPGSDLATFDRRMLRKLPKIAKLLDVGFGSIRLGLSEPEQPLVAYIGGIARVVIMPRRDTTDDSIPPVFDPFPGNGEPS